MRDPLLELLGLFLEVIVEAAFEFALEVLSALAWRAVAEFFDTWEFWEFKDSLPMTVALLLLGGAAGALSLLVFPHPLVHPYRFHGISLIVSPALAGLGMSLVGFCCGAGTRNPCHSRVLAMVSRLLSEMAVIRFLSTQ